jgi:hypothetical protein
MRPTMNLSNRPTVQLRGRANAPRSCLWRPEPSSSRRHVAAQVFGIRAIDVFHLWSEVDAAFRIELFEKIEEVELTGGQLYRFRRRKADCLACSLTDAHGVCFACPWHP